MFFKNVHEEFYKYHSVLLLYLSFIYNIYEYISSRIHLHYIYVYFHLALRQLYSLHQWYREQYLPLGVVFKLLASGSCRFHNVVLLHFCL